MEEIKWITVKGSHIPIKKGQTVDQAIKEFYNSKTTKELEKICKIKVNTKKIKGGSTSSSINLSAFQWRRYYDRLAGINKGEWVYKGSNGLLFIPLHKMEKNENPVLVLLSGSFAKPKVKMVLEFIDDDRMYDFMEIIKNGIK